MSEKTADRPQPLIRRSFIGALLAGAAICGGVLWYLTDGINGGGQTAESPDGKFMIVVWRNRESAPLEPYRVTLKDYPSGQNLREFSVHPVDGIPNQVLRGGPRVIRWDDFSQFADLVIDGETYCRFFVPKATVRQPVGDKQE